MQELKNKNRKVKDDFTTLMTSHVPFGVQSDSGMSQNHTQKGLSKFNG